MILTIIIPMFNSEDYIEETISSVISQEVSDIEVIVVDDGSTDNGPELVEDLASKYDGIRLIKNKRKKGVSGARNTGILDAKSEFITFLDSDDILLPNTLDKRIKHIKTYPQVNVFCWDYGKFKHLNDLFVGEIFEKNSVRDELASFEHVDNTFVINDPVSLFLENTCIIWTGAVILKKDHVDKIGLFNEEMSRCEDTEYWFRACLGQTLLFIAELSTGYRDREDSVSKDQTKMFLAIIELRDRLLKNEDFKSYKKQIIARRLNDVVCFGYYFREKKLRSLLVQATKSQIMKGVISWQLLKNLFAGLFNR